MSRPSMTPEPSLFGPFALATDEFLAHIRVDGDDTHRPRHLRVANFDGGVDVVHEYAVGHLQFHVGGQFGHGRRVLRVDPTAYGAEGDGPVHRPGVQVRHPQLGGHRPCHGRFA